MALYPQNVTDPASTRVRDKSVAIEWGFYAFVFLSITCIVIGLVGDRLYEQRRFSDLRRIDIFARIYYPVFIIVVVLAYFLHFRSHV